MKKTIAAIILFAIAFSLLGNALAAPTPTPTPTPPPKSTPAVGAQPPSGGNGSGGGGGGGGTKPGDGPSGTGKPEATAPPKKDKPGDEDNTPIEVEPPDDGNDADIKPKKKKAKEYEKEAVWTISFKGAKDSAPFARVPVLKNCYTLDLTATRQDGGGMLGQYKGAGKLTNEIEVPPSEDAYVELAFSGGPLSGIEFELYRPSPDAVGEDELTPLEEKLAPLVPDETRMPAFTGETKSSMTWNPESVRGYGVGRDGDVHSANLTADPRELTYYLYVYPSGKAELSLHDNASTRALKFWGKISKKINWKQV